MNAPLGFLDILSTSEDRILYAYRRDRKTVRGVFWVLFSLLLVAGAMALSRAVGEWYGWLAGVIPLIAASGAAYVGMLDLLNRPLFQLEVDRRARTVTLAMPREKGHDLAKVGFGDVVAVEIAEKAGAWNVTLRLKDARRIGLGISADKAKSEDVAARFASLIGVDVVRAA